MIAGCAGLTLDIDNVFDEVSVLTSQLTAAAAITANRTDARLADEHVEEVRRRRADPNPRRLTLEEFKERLSRRLDV